MDSCTICFQRKLTEFLILLLLLKYGTVLKIIINIRTRIKNIYKNYFRIVSLIKNTRLR